MIVPSRLYSAVEMWGQQHSGHSGNYRTSSMMKIRYPFTHTHTEHSSSRWPYSDDPVQSSGILSLQVFLDKSSQKYLDPKVKSQWMSMLKSAIAADRFSPSGFQLQ